MAEPAQHVRTSGSFTAAAEKRLLQKLAAALPPWIMPDHLTGLGLLASTLVGVGYMLTNQHEHWLWLVNAAIVLNWFGDSLDGTVARYRKAERPRYGYYLDHLTDAYSTLMIGLGLGFSPYMLLAVGLGIVVAYLLLSINVYLETHVFGEFTFSYGSFGPTEARIALIVLNLLALTYEGARFTVLGIGVTPFDVAGVLVGLGMLAMLLGRALANLRRLAAAEPARRWRPGG
ncbi:MAG TPA: CDP-alcohol phosphatidyltransferase family protein [Longimicrobiales bacterium]|nr:CDP-alcohol phosphatidyltransferase family protein [Longimicrobiales bacterium]